MASMWTTVYCAVFGLLLFAEVNCIQKRCVRCRSRGELGSCGDPFPFNATNPEAEVGVHSVACPTGWCAKLIETNNAFKSEYGEATQRMCLQRPPTNHEELCAYTTYNYRRVYMCLCRGDLCNSASPITIPYVLLSPILIALINMQFW